MIPIQRVNLGGGGKILRTSSQLCSVLHKKVDSRVAEMTPWLRALAVLLEDSDSVTSSHIMAYDICMSSSRGSDALLWSLQALHACVI